jgi:hypothetical protein
MYGPGTGSARTALSLSDHRLAAIARTSIQFSGAPRPIVVEAITHIHDWLHSLPECCAYRISAVQHAEQLRLPSVLSSGHMWAAVTATARHGTRLDSERMWILQQVTKDRLRAGRNTKKEV